MRWLLPSMLFFGCAHAPPPPPKAQVPLQSTADLKGSYNASNEVDWGYFLTIDADGTLDLVVDRGKMGRCEQKGKLEPGADKQTMTIIYTRNECDRAHMNMKLTVHVDSYTGDELVLAVTGDGVDEHRHFMRKPGSVPSVK